MGFEVLQRSLRGPPRRLSEEISWPLGPKLASKGGPESLHGEPRESAKSLSKTGSSRAHYDEPPLTMPEQRKRFPSSEPLAVAAPGIATARGSITGWSMWQTGLIFSVPRRPLPVALTSFSLLGRALPTVPSQAL